MRTSTTRQKPDSQEQAIRDYCDGAGLKLREVFTDHGKPGGDGLEHRPGLVGALGALRRARSYGPTAFVAWDSSRLARQPEVDRYIRWAVKANGAELLLVVPGISGEAVEEDLAARGFVISRAREIAE